MYHVTNLLAELNVVSITNRAGWRIELECVLPSLDISPLYFFVWNLIKKTSMPVISKQSKR